MRVIQAVLILCLLFPFISCSSKNSNTQTANASPSASGPSPKDTFKANYDALKRKDVEAFKKTFSKRWLKVTEEMAKNDNKSLDDFLRDEMMSLNGPELLPDAAREETGEDRARLEVSDAEGQRPHIYKFVKEDGQWKLDSY